MDAIKEDKIQIYQFGSSIKKDDFNEIDLLMI